MLDKKIDFLNDLNLGQDGIYGHNVSSGAQSVEITLREEVADNASNDYMSMIANSHSIPVMDFEVNRMLRLLPKDSVVLDVGGCWGWHWRNILDIRPDIKIIIIDFVRANLLHAKKVLSDLINSSVYLLHNDATDLEIPNNAIDCYWSVQALQHIPDYNKAIDEAYRVIKPGGLFFNYSLNDQPIIRWLYKIMKKQYVVKGNMQGSFYICRASNEQKLYIEKIFQQKVIERWSEIIFKPELHIAAAGREGALMGSVDSKLSNDFGLFSSIARQKSYHCMKSTSAK